MLICTKQIINFDFLKKRKFKIREKLKDLSFLFFARIIRYK